jgi:serine/threonine protein kinase
MHRDIKGSNLLVNNEGILKVGDFGLANFCTSGHRQPLTSRVVTLWYRPPELLLGSTDYGASVDLWSVGCVFAELLLGKPILQGRTEVSTYMVVHYYSSSLFLYDRCNTLKTKVLKIYIGFREYFYSHIFLRLELIEAKFIHILYNSSIHEWIVQVKFLKDYSIMMLDMLFFCPHRYVIWQ